MSCNQILSIQDKSNFSERSKKREKYEQMKEENLPKKLKQQPGKKKKGKISPIIGTDIFLDTVKMEFKPALVLFLFFKPLLV